MKCGKCDGTGYISGFAHIANGRCFQCGGSGELPESKKRNVSYSLSYLSQFRQAGYFPEDQSGMVRIQCVSMEGHPTAETWLLKNCTDYYLGQPVCRGSIWYRFPVSELPDFVTHYNRVFKTHLEVEKLLNFPA